MKKVAPLIRDLTNKIETIFKGIYPKNGLLNAMIISFFVNFWSFMTEEERNDCLSKCFEDIKKMLMMKETSFTWN